MRATDVFWTNCDDTVGVRGEDEISGVVGYLTAAGETVELSHQDCLSLVEHLNILIGCAGHG